MKMGTLMVNDPFTVGIRDRIRQLAQYQLQSHLLAYYRL